MWGLCNKLYLRTASAHCVILWITWFAMKCIKYLQNTRAVQAQELLSRAVDMIHCGPRNFSLLRLNLEIAMVQPPSDLFVCEPISIYTCMGMNEYVEHRIYPVGLYRMYYIPGEGQWIHSKADNIRQYWSAPRHSVYGSETTAIECGPDTAPHNRRHLLNSFSNRFLYAQRFVCRCVDGMADGVEQQHRSSWRGACFAIEMGDQFPVRFSRSS